MLEVVSVILSRCPLFLSRGIYLPDKKIPIFSEVAKDWLEYKKPNLRASTWSNYESYARNHFPDLNRIKVNRITIADIEKFIATWQKTGMHIKTLKRIIMIAGQILSYAVRHKYISYNPIRDIERPKSQGKEKKQTIRVLSPMEINSLFKAEKNLKYKTIQSAAGKITGSLFLCNK